jgi:hypothetical protein
MDFNVLIEQGEAKLLEKGVPSRYWGYILANGAPGTLRHDGLGAIYRKRKHLVESISKVPSSKDMGIAVVDGRDLVTIRKWIGGRDWTQEEEAKWLESL